jgi:hypothetical protein
MPLDSSLAPMIQARRLAIRNDIRSRLRSSKAYLLSADSRGRHAIRPTNHRLSRLRSADRRASPAWGAVPSQHQRLGLAWPRRVLLGIRLPTRPGLGHAMAKASGTTLRRGRRHHPARTLPGSTRYGSYPAAGALRVAPRVDTAATARERRPEAQSGLLPHQPLLRPHGARGRALRHGPRSVPRRASDRRRLGPAHPQSHPARGPQPSRHRWIVQTQELHGVG